MTILDSLKVVTQKIKEYIDAGLSNRYTKEESDKKYLTDHQDVSMFITKAVSDLENYYTKSLSYTREEINQLISAIPKFNVLPVDVLPISNISATTIYLLKTSETETGNLYTEYIYVNSKWEKLGTQTLDLSGYALKTDIPEPYNDAAINKKVDDLETYANSSYRTLNENKISKPSDAPQVGKVLKVKSVNEDGTFVCEWADDSNDGAVKDVQISGTSVVKDGVATMPIAGDDKLGVSKFLQKNGMYASSDGTVQSVICTEHQYYNYLNDRGFVAKGTLENAKGSIVRSVADPLYASKETLFTPYVDENGDLVLGDVGNEKWELITDFVCDEDCKYVDITKDMNGNQFSLKKLVFKQYILASNASGRAGIKILNIPEELYFTADNAMTTGTNNYTKGYVENIRGIYVGRVTGQYTGESSYSATLVSETTSNIQFKPISGYRWVQLNNGIIKAGSTLKVWGIRA